MTRHNKVEVVINNEYCTLFDRHPDKDKLGGSTHVSFYSITPGSGYTPNNRQLWTPL